MIKELLQENNSSIANTCGIERRECTDKRQGGLIRNTELGKGYLKKT